MRPYRLQEGFYVMPIRFFPPVAAAAIDPASICLTFARSDCRCIPCNASATNDPFSLIDSAIPFRFRSQHTRHRPKKGAKLRYLYPSPPLFRNGLSIWKTPEIIFRFRSIRFRFGFFLFIHSFLSFHHRPEHFNYHLSPFHFVHLPLELFIVRLA